MCDRDLNLHTQFSQAQKAIANITHHVSRLPKMFTRLSILPELNRAIFAI
jgi:hypothetical protein